MKLARLLSPGLTGQLIALLAGALMTLSFAPFNYWPTGIISVFIYGLCLHTLTPKQAIWRGWFYGFGLFGAGASWVYVSIHEHGHAPIPLALLLTFMWAGSLAFCLSLNSYLYTKFLRDKPLGLLIGFPVLWVLNEWFRLWFLTGFPWLYLGYAHTETWLAGWAPLVGVLGVSFTCAITAAVGCFLYLHSTASHKIKFISISLVLSLWVIGAGLQQINWVNKKGEAITIGMVQANIPQEQKWNPQYRQKILRKYRDLTEPLWGMDIIIWPETAIPMLYSQASGYIESLDLQAKKSGSTFISGIPFSADGRDGFYNGVFSLGDTQGKYYKRHLVPFGEYMPLEEILRGLIAFFDLPMSNFVSGPTSQPYITADGLKIATFICYEIVYPDMVAAESQQADLLLTVSNDSWFGKSIGPIQHLEMVQMRAIENGRYILRGTNNGISAIIDEKGKITKRGGQFTQEVITGKAYAMSGATPFSQTGNWLIITLCFLLTLLPLLKSRLVSLLPKNG